MDQDAGSRLLSSGTVARELGCSVSLLKQLDVRGLLPGAMRLVGTNRRVWRASDLPTLREAMQDRRDGRRQPSGEAA